MHARTHARMHGHARTNCGVHFSVCVLACGVRVRVPVVRTRGVSPWALCVGARRAGISPKTPPPKLRGRRRVLAVICFALMDGLPLQVPTEPGASASAETRS
jgi:hypothetical protein